MTFHHYSNVITNLYEYGQVKSDIYYYLWQMCDTVQSLQNHPKTDIYHPIFFTKNQCWTIIAKVSFSKHILIFEFSVHVLAWVPRTTLQVLPFKPYSVSVILSQYFSITVCSRIIHRYKKIAIKKQSSKMCDWWIILKATDINI